MIHAFSFASSSPSSFITRRGARQTLLVRASSDEKPKSDDEIRVELLEQRIKAGRSAETKPLSPPPSARMTQQQQQPPKTNWPEGQLFPDGFEQMTLDKKLNELYMGERGLLFWLNKAAYASVFLLLGGWAIFRFVGPALGLYTLAGDGPRL